VTLGRAVGHNNCSIATIENKSARKKNLSTRAHTWMTTAKPCKYEIESKIMKL